MSYLKDAKESLKNIDDLCNKALKERDDFEFYIREINSHSEAVIDNLEHLISELKLGEKKLIEASGIIEEYLNGKD